MTDLSRAVWRKSIRSNNMGNCVEVATNLAAESGVLVRDSKNPDGGLLTVTPAGFAAFLHGVKSGDFDG